jgi:DNA polymerase III epsilon subunit-like protein
MNYTDYVIWDLETTGKDPETAQIVQIAAVTVHGRKLTVKPGTEFNTLVKPLYGEEAEALGLEELSDGAINVHGKTHEMLNEAPSLESSLKNFKDYVDDKNFKKNSWNAPIAGGYNINGYDIPILKRDLKRFKLDYPFQPVYTVDMLQWMFAFFENNKEVRSLSADNLVRNYMGYSKANAHDALGDVHMTADLFCRSMKFIRNNVNKQNFKGCFA